MIHIESAGLSDVGKQRDQNEDAFFLDDKLQLYVVADGMGGHQAGEVASGLVVEKIRDSVERLLHHGEGEEATATDETLSREANGLLASIREASRLVFGKAQEEERHRGMGSTVAAVYCTDSVLIAANVGDSPIYLVRGGEIECLSVPHTLAAEQSAIQPEMAEILEERFHHVVTRAMGIAEQVEPDVCEVQCFKGDTVILCSDGLSNKVSPEEMLEIVNGNHPEESCRLFVDLANDRGGDDNITVVVLRINMAKSKVRGLLDFLLRRSANVIGFLKGKSPIRLNREFPGSG
jgi:protein phosphatase